MQHKAFPSRLLLGPTCSAKSGNVACVSAKTGDTRHAGRVTVWGACREEPDWQSSSTAEMPIEKHIPGCHGECWLRCPGTLPDMTRWSTEESNRCISTWSQVRFYLVTFPSGRVREALTHQSTSALPGPKSRTRGCNRLCLAQPVQGCQIFPATNDPVG